MFEQGREFTPPRNRGEKEILAKTYAGMTVFPSLVGTPTANLYGFR